MISVLTYRSDRTVFCILQNRSGAPRLHAPVLYLYGYYKQFGSKQNPPELVKKREYAPDSSTPFFFRAGRPVNSKKLCSRF